jgi:hypothetical protein
MAGGRRGEDGALWILNPSPGPSAKRSGSLLLAEMSVGVI